MIWRKPLPRNFKPGVKGFARVGALPAESVLQTQTRPRKQPKSALDNKLLEFSAQLHQKQRNGQPYINGVPDLCHLVTEFDRRSGAVLLHELPYESRPSAARRITFSSKANDVFLVAHVAENDLDFHVSISSGFALNVGLTSGPLIVTCAHTLEEIRYSGLLSRPGTRSCSMLVVDQGTRTSIYPIHYIPSSLPRYDICLFLASRSKDHQPLPSLPVSPYPVHAGTKVRAHFVANMPPPGEEDHWSPCFDSELHRRWVSGEVQGYRDFAGNEAQPGRYDTLAHMSFMPIPTAGSSGGPTKRRAL